VDSLERSLPLVLFDIDGTLISRAGPHHKRALTEAVRLVMGHDVSLDGIPTQGMLDCELFRILLQPIVQSADPISQALPHLIAAAQQQYLVDCPETLAERVCPGVVPFLESLRQADIPCAIVSGNLRAIGWKKLELAGLRPYFQTGAFAEDGDTRSDLVRTLLNGSRLSGGPRGPVSLIGDHQNDIRAARANGIRSIAVATGLSSLEELQSEEPDLLFEDLTSASLQHVL
jgi:phosphoglycolate phosphatase